MSTSLWSRIASRGLTSVSAGFDRYIPLRTKGLPSSFSSASRNLREEKCVCASMRRDDVGAAVVVWAAPGAGAPSPATTALPAPASSARRSTPPSLGGDGAPAVAGGRRSLRLRVMGDLPAGSWWIRDY